MNIPDNVKKLSLTDITEATFKTYKQYMSNAEIKWWKDWYPRYCMYRLIIQAPNFKDETTRERLKGFMGIHRFYGKFTDRLPDNLKKKGVTKILVHEYASYEPYMTEEEKALWARHMEGRRAQKREARKAKAQKVKKVSPAMAKALELASKIREIREAKLVC